MIAPDPLCEDFAYTDQFFALTRQGHTRPTAEFGAPAMVWHVAFWPRRVYDPHDLEMFDPATKSGLKRADMLLKEHGERFAAVTRDFNGLLERLRKRGWFQHLNSKELEFAHEAPGGWDYSIGTPFNKFGTNAHGFTLWWCDREHLPADPEANMIGLGVDDRPRDTDVRVRVQTEVSEDFCSITFYIDAGKPWNGLPAYSSGEADSRQVSGRRRKEIYDHVTAIKSTCEARLKRQPDGKALVDLPLVPERIAKEAPGNENDHAFWLAGEQAAAQRLLAAADYLYDTVWDDFCKDFGFNLCDIAGQTDEVFANFRGLVLSAGGTAPLSEGVTPEKAPDLGLSEFPRFEADHDHSGYGSRATEPNAVVRAYVPFMRRFRSEADWRDWIACGVFDWRAIYITPLGSQSEFRGFDDAELSVLYPGEALPKRLTTDEDPSKCAACATYAEGGTGSERYPRSRPATPQNDRPAPFRYLLLTKSEPNRKQVGRIVERINTTGNYRLYAIKNWDILQQASTWVRVYGQQLDAAYKLWIDEDNKIREKRDVAEEAVFVKLRELVLKLKDPLAKEECLAALHQGEHFPDQAIANLINAHRKFVLSKTLGARLHWKNMWSSDQKVWNDIYACFGELRAKKEDFDRKLAECNVDAEAELVKITSALDKLGNAAIGGLSYRVSRSRYYADMYRATLPTLRTGNIETWWSYEQFAKRGMEPALRFIESLGDRLERLRERLQSVKNDILQNSINNQTEATRDNTHKLERIQDTISHLSETTALAEKRAFQAQLVYMILVAILAICNLMLVVPKVLDSFGG